VACPIADIFREAADLNVADPRRNGNTVRIEPGCEVIATGDLHGHRANLMKIVSYTDLGAREDRRLVLQEIVHAPPDPRTGHDRSVDVLLRAARLKISHPKQVLFILGNHDVAQATGNEITKAGRGVCEDFAAGVLYACGEDDAPEVLEAITTFLLSTPIAVRCPGGVWISHTLPTPQRMEHAGRDVPEAPYGSADLRRGGRVYEWTWGRRQTPEQVDDLAQHLGACFFVLGHRHIDSAYEFIGPKAVILTAEHDRGCLLEFCSDQPLSEADARDRLKPIASLSRGGG